jgi:hypothetical protein
MGHDGRAVVANLTPACWIGFDNTAWLSVVNLEVLSNANRLALEAQSCHV